VSKAREEAYAWLLKHGVVRADGDVLVPTTSAVADALVEFAAGMRNTPVLGGNPPVCTEVLQELARARNLHPSMASAHEGYAILLEEVDELWDEVKGHHPDRAARIRDEAIQVAAMALRFIEDVCDGGSK
jgi:hypothetical protein